LELEVKREKIRLWRIKNRDKINAYKRQWVIEHPEKRNEYHLKWRKNNPTYYPQYIKKWNSDYPAKRLAEHVAETYLKIGSECEFCEDTKSLVLHHPNYRFPLITVTCCQTCHKWIHKDPPADYYNAPFVEPKLRQCSTCRKKIPDCGKERASYRSRGGCMIWESRELFLETEK
jgi:hypothetical protein